MLNSDELKAALAGAAGGRMFEIADGLRRQMGADGKLITIRRDAEPVPGAVCTLDIVAPRGHEAVVRRLVEECLAGKKAVDVNG